MERRISHDVSHSQRSLRIPRIAIPRNVHLFELPRLRVPLLEQTPASLLRTLRGRHTYDTLVLSGGGIKGITMLGAMGYMHDEGVFRHIDHFIGTSVGAIVATAMAMGLVPREVFRHHVIPFTYSPDIDLTRLERNFGLDSGKNLEKWIAAFIPETTFSAFYKTYKKSVTVCVTNLNTHSAEYCSKETTPDLSIRTALRMSCSVPLYFSAVKYNGNLYVDGGVACNFPIRYAFESGGKNVLGVRFSAPEKQEHHSWTLESFLGALLESNVNRKHPHGATVVKLETGSITQPLNFKLSKHEKKELYRTGYQQMELFFKKHQ